MSGDCKELQEEEREALCSIYDGDEQFKQINETTYQYKYGENDDKKSFLVEMSWGANYPNELPNINMDTFFNGHLSASTKEKISEVLREEAQQWLGCGMTYTLFECLKDKLDDLVTEPTNEAKGAIDTAPVFEALKIADNVDEGSKKTPKKEQLTKAQKRRQWNHTDFRGEHVRGWDWVDIVKHLSQTGGKNEDVSMGVNIGS